MLFISGEKAKTYDFFIFDVHFIFLFSNVFWKKNMGKWTKIHFVFLITRQNKKKEHILLNNMIFQFWYEKIKKVCVGGIPIVVSTLI